MAEPITLEDQAMDVITSGTMALPLEADGEALYALIVRKDDVLKV
jgi:hypothetical protein